MHPSTTSRLSPGSQSRRSTTSGSRSRSSRRSKKESSTLTFPGTSRGPPRRRFLSSRRTAQCRRRTVGTPPCRSACRRGAAGDAGGAGKRSRGRGRMPCRNGRRRLMCARCRRGTSGRAGRYTTSRRATAALRRTPARRSSTATSPCRTSATFARWWRTRRTGSSSRDASAGSSRFNRNSPRSRRTRRRTRTSSGAGFASRRRSCGWWSCRTACGRTSWRCSAS